MPKFDYINRRESSNVISYRAQLLINVVIWFLIGAFLAHILQWILNLFHISYVIDWVGAGSLFAILLGYIGWIIRKISFSNKKQ